MPHKWQTDKIKEYIVVIIIIIKFSLIAKPCEWKRFRNICTLGLFQKLYEIGVMKIWNWSNAPAISASFVWWFFLPLWTTLFIHSNILHKLVLPISLLLFFFISGKNLFFLTGVRVNCAKYTEEEQKCAENHKYGHSENDMNAKNR